VTAAAFATPGDALVIGGGLAGASAAAALAAHGWKVRVFDAAREPASGASALPAGLMAPHLSGDDNLLSQLSRHGVQATWRHAKALLREGIDWCGSGTLEHRVKSRRGAPPPDRHPPPRHPDASTRQRAAACLPQEALAVWHPRAAWIRPAALVHAWLAHPAITWVGGTHIADLQRAGAAWRLIDSNGHEVARAPLVLIAAALGSGPLAGTRLSLHAVRGQISWGLQSAAHGLPEFPINGHGHLLSHIPTEAGLSWISGSSYGRGDTGTDERSEDHADNLARLRILVPALAERLAAEFAQGRVQAWTGVRCASTDRRPLVGELEPGLWVTTAMGSRGLTFAALCADLLAARLHGEALPLPPPLAAALDLARQRP
jgi:tRNA 5-methylaminomethyl-2-thiouridine biosynthesis bifunctional protein